MADRLYGRANALTRGKGRKVGLHRITMASKSSRTVAAQGIRPGKTAAMQPMPPPTSGTRPPVAPLQPVEMPYHKPTMTPGAAPQPIALAPIYGPTVRRR